MYCWFCEDNKQSAHSLWTEPPADTKFSGLIFSDAVPWRGSADQRQMLKGVMKVMHYILKKWDIKARRIPINWQVHELQLVSCVCLATTGKCLFGLDFTPWSRPPPWKACLRSREQWQSHHYSKAFSWSCFFFNTASKTVALSSVHSPQTPAYASTQWSRKFFRQRHMYFRGRFCT